MVDNGEWEVLDVACNTNTITYPCCEEEFDDATFIISIKRKPMFYLYNLLFPCVMLSLIGILVFLLPSESGEKASLAVTVLLAMTVFMHIIMGHVPATSEVIPLLGK